MGLLTSHPFSTSGYNTSCTYQERFRCRRRVFPCNMYLYNPVGRDELTIRCPPSLPASPNVCVCVKIRKEMRSRDLKGERKEKKSRFGEGKGFN